MFRKKVSHGSKKPMNILPLLGIVFAVFGGVLLGKLARYQFNIGPITSDIIYPLSFIEWVAALGCLFGGLYIFYKSVFKRMVLFRY